MNKIEKMHISEIIDETNLAIDERTMLEIWKSKSGVREFLVKNPEFIEELLHNFTTLQLFLCKHDKDIDKIKFLMILLKNYKETISDINSNHEEVEISQRGISAIKKILEGVNETYVFFDTDSQTRRILKLMILNSVDEVQGRDRKNKNNNRERLEQLEKELSICDVAQGIVPMDFETTIAFDPKVGKEMAYMSEYNSLIREYGNDIDLLNCETPIQELIEGMDRLNFIEETLRTLTIHIEEVNFDKMLLCSAYRYIEAIEKHMLQEDGTSELNRRLRIIREHINKNVTINFYPDVSYSVSDLDADLKRFISNREQTKYISLDEAKQFKEELLSGEISLNSIQRPIFEALSLAPSTLSEILRKRPTNYIYFLRQEGCQYNKLMILKDIRNARICNTDLLQLLCEKAELTSEEVCDLFDEEIITATDLIKIKKYFSSIISNDTLFEKYKQYKMASDKEKESAQVQLERYALAYRNTELLGKTQDEIQAKGEEFIEEIGEDIEQSDLIPLYGLGIIPLNIAVEWGGEDIIEELLETEKLKPFDARYLRNTGLLDENILERLFQKCNNMSYAYQVSLVFATFDGQSQEEQEIREKLAQYYHIEATNFKNSSKNTGIKRNHRNFTEQTENAKVKMRDPGAKYNLLSAIDNDVRIEEGIIDGHIIFHYPNVDGGTVLIEKLHKIKTNKQSGLIEIKADNESATYVLSEEEFIKIRSQLIKEGKVDRTELTQRWWITRDPEHWIPHTGISAWENSIKDRFGINEENTRYTPDDLNKINELIEKSIESKKMDER